MSDFTTHLISVMLLTASRLATCVVVYSRVLLPDCASWVACSERRSFSLRIVLFLLFTGSRPSLRRAKPGLQYTSKTRLYSVKPEAHANSVGYA